MSYALDANVRDLALYTGTELGKIDGGLATLTANVAPTPQMFGAVGDGDADDTAAIQVWASNGGGAVFGDYRLSSPVELFNRPLVIRGGGSKKPTFRLEGSGGFRFSRDQEGANSLAIMDVSDVAFVPTGASQCTAIRLEEVRPATGTQVCGGVDFLRMDNVEFLGDATNYWRHCLHTINAGGVVGSRVTFGSHSSYAAQSDPTTIHIVVDNTQPNVNVIRALQLVNIYARRAHKIIQVNSINGVESIYLTTGEVVGTQRAIEINGPGNMGATSIDGLHFDVLGEVLWGSDNTAVTLIRFNGADLRKGNNGGSYSPGHLIRLAKGETFTASGCMFSGSIERNPTGPEHAGIMIEGSYTRANVDDSSTFRNMAVGVQTGGTANRVRVGNIHTAFVTTPFKNDSVSSLNERLSTFLEHSGDLNTLADRARGVTYTRLLAGATNLPSGVAGAGHIVRTTVFDVNAAYQELLSLNTTFVLSHRRKAAGTWGPWLSVSALPASGPCDLQPGTGSPEGVMAAPVGSTYRRLDGGAGTAFYVKESGGSGSTGWVAK